jgi:peptide/nickel transport system ATP-binding protein
MSPQQLLMLRFKLKFLDLMRDIKVNRNAGIVLITHDLGVVAEMCDKVAVMYAGRVVEYTDVYSLFKNPQHPYTIGLA